MNNKLNREVIKLVIASILARSGESLYENEEAKKLKMKIISVTRDGINIPRVGLSLCSPHGS